MKFLEKNPLLRASEPSACPHLGVEKEYQWVLLEVHQEILGLVPHSSFQTSLLDLLLDLRLGLIVSRKDGILALVVEDLLDGEVEAVAKLGLIDPRSFSSRPNAWRTAFNGQMPMTTLAGARQVQTHCLICASQLCGLLDMLLLICSSGSVTPIHRPEGLCGPRSGILWLFNSSMSSFSLLLLVATFGHLEVGGLLVVAVSL